MLKTLKFICDSQNLANYNTLRVKVKGLLGLNNKLYYFLNKYDEIGIIYGSNYDTITDRRNFMSKKCCGIIYSDSDENCEICGKKLIDTDENISDDNDDVNVEDILEETLNNVVLEEEELPSGIDEAEKKSANKESSNEKSNENTDSGEEDEEDTDEEDEENADKASGWHKAFGIISIVLAVAGLALIGLCVYFLIISPFYTQKGADGRQPVYPEIATMTDASITDMRGILPYAEPATATDAVIATTSDAATTTDAASVTADETADTTDNTVEDGYWEE